jgi:hypothetical protein
MERETQESGGHVSSMEGQILDAICKIGH